MNAAPIGGREPRACHDATHRKDSGTQQMCSRRAHPRLPRHPQSQCRCLRPLMHHRDVSDATPCATHNSYPPQQQKGSPSAHPRLPMPRRRVFRCLALKSNQVKSNQTKSKHRIPHGGAACHWRATCAHTNYILPRCFSPGTWTLARVRFAFTATASAVAPASPRWLPGDVRGVGAMRDATVMYRPRRATPFTHCQI